MPIVLVDVTREVWSQICGRFAHLLLGSFAPAIYT